MKRLKLFALPAAMACAVLLQAQGLIPQPAFGVTGEKQFETHFYRLYTGPADLETARKIAARDGGYLIEIDTLEENQFLAEWFEAYVGKFLIGGTRNEKGQWLNAEGKALSFLNWADPEAVAASVKSASAAVIEFAESGGKWEAVPSTARAAGFILEFNTKPKPVPKNTETFGFEEQSEATTDEELETIEKNEPVLSELPTGGLSANLFFSKYAYAGGIFRDRYADKDVSVTGITRVADIREITEDDRLWAKYKGKFFMRLLGDNVICFLNSMPLIDKNSTRVMVKVEGKITKGPQFQQIILDDARFTNYRRVQPQRRLPTGKDEKRTRVAGLLTKFDSLLDNGTFELQINPEGGTITCTLGNDPDAYGMELYWLKNTSSIDKLVVNVSGIKSLPDDATSPMIDCLLGGWADPAAAGRQRPRKEERKEKKEENGK